MRLRDLAISLDPGAKESLQLQITRTLGLAIRNGRIQPGMALPGSRQIAEELGVHRNTVLAALRELEAEGWVETRPGSGTFVTTTLPDLTPCSWGAFGDEPKLPPSDPGYDLPLQLSPITTPFLALMDMSDGLADVRLAPTEALGRAYQRALRLHGDKLLQYGEPKGNLMLRQALAAMLSERRGLVTDPDQILVTRGSRMALDLVTLSLFKQGGVIAVEDPGNRAAWETIQQSCGAVLQPVPVDAEGMDLDALEILLKKQRVDLIYLTPHHQNPTTVSLSPNRRMRLLELAQRHRMAVLEDDYDFEYQYNGRSLLPLASGDPTGQVIYMGSLSKLIAPGVRLGFLVAPKGLVERLARVRLRMDWQGDRVLEWAVADLFRDGDMARHVRKVRKAYEERRDHLVACLREELDDVLSFSVPEGGLALWVHANPGLDLEAWTQRCKQQSLIIQPGSHFSFNRTAIGATRLGFAQSEPRQLEDAVHRMKACL